MKINEYGTENTEIILMFPPLGVKSDVYDFVRPQLEKKYHIMVVSYPGVDDGINKNFSSVEEVVSEVEDWLLEKNYSHVKCIFGCSMGGGMVARMINNRKIEADYFIMDGGMTPYELPKPITYLIGVRDFLMISSAKLLGPKVLREVMNPDKFSDQDAVYMKECIGTMSSKTIWRCFYSANNYKLDLPIQPPKGKTIYWYGEEEKKDRAWDIKYIEKHMPWAELVENPGIGHAEFFTLYPDRFVEQLEKYINGEVN